MEKKLSADQNPEDNGEQIDLKKMMNALLQLSNKITVLETESIERRAMQQVERPENATAGAAAASSVKARTEDEEEKVMVDEEAMEIMDKMYLSDMETPVDILTGTPTRVFVEDHVDFESQAFPMLIKEDMMRKRDPDLTSHNPKVDKCKNFLRKQMAVRNTWELSEEKQ